MATNTNKNSRPRNTSKLGGPKPGKKPAAVIKKGVTKQDRLIELLQQETGATTIELAAALSWLPHTTRAALTGLRKKGHTVLSEKVNGETHYRIERAAA